MNGTLYLHDRQKPGPKPQGLSKSERIFLLAVFALTLSAGLYFKLQNTSPSAGISLAQKEIVWQSAKR